MGEQDDQKVTLGEVFRLQQALAVSVEKLASEMRVGHHSLTNQMNVAIAPISEMKVRVDRCETDINGLGVKIALCATDADMKELATRLDEVRRRSDRIAGAAGLAALAGGSLVAWLLSWFRH